MKGTINSEKSIITLEDGKQINIQDGEATGDFIARAKKEVKAEYLEGLDLSKESETEALGNDLIKKSQAKLKGNGAEPNFEGGPDEIEKQKAAQAQIEAKQAALKAKAEAKAAAQKAKIEAKQAAQKAKEEAQAEALKAKEEEAKKALEARKEELAGKAEEMTKEAEAKALQMVEDAKAKAEEYLAKQKELITRMVETGQMRSAKTSSGLRVEPDPTHVDGVDAIVGKRVSFEKYGMTIIGVVKARTVDYRVGIVMARIQSDEGLVYHKSFNNLDQLTILEDETV